MRIITFVIVGFLCVLTLSACASSIMQSYVGKSVQDVMLDYGAPDNAFDMPDGRRVFQWVKESSYTTPINVHTSGRGTGSVYGRNITSWTSSNSVITGGQTVKSDCVYSLFAEWNKSVKAWYITGFKKPNLMCE